MNSHLPRSIRFHSLVYWDHGEKYIVSTSVSLSNKRDHVAEARSETLDICHEELIAKVPISWVGIEILCKPEFPHEKKVTSTKTKKNTSQIIPEKTLKTIV